MVSLSEPEEKVFYTHEGTGAVIKEQKVLNRIIIQSPTPEIHDFLRQLFLMSLQFGETFKESLLNKDT